MGPPQSPVSGAAAATVLLLPLFFATLPFDWVTFSPRRLLHSSSATDFLPVLLSAWAPTSTPGDALSRLIQGVLFALCFPLAPPGPLYIFLVLVNIVRLPIGFLLTRSVGWAIPSLFSHYALYETTAGFGPALVGLAALSPHLGLPFWAVSLAAVVGAILERRPWSYGVGLVITLPIALAEHLLPRKGCFRSLSGRSTPSGVAFRDLVPSYSAFQSFRVPSRTDTGTRDSGYSPRESEKGSILAYTARPLRPALLPIAIAIVPLALIAVFRPEVRLFVPAETSLHILLLTFPRPIATDVHTGMLKTTIDSFVPHLSAHVTLGAFTHAADHAALTAVNSSYAPNPHIAFFSDTDEHPDDTDGHFLHLAEAYRWTFDASPAEWVMLVEDDFPVCPGGWPVIATVMAQLHISAHPPDGSGLASSPRAGFVGTGGSGIILHRSAIPPLIRQLRAYSASAAQVPKGALPRAPDEVVQDCAVGAAGSLCARPPDARLVITSRLVLDHIGGMATTTEGKAHNSDKWRCGWRHAWHGGAGYDVVVV